MKVDESFLLILGLEQLALAQVGLGLWLDHKQFGYKRIVILKMKHVIIEVKRTFDQTVIMNNSWMINLIVIIILMDITCTTIHNSATLVL